MTPTLRPQRVQFCVERLEVWAPGVTTPDERAAWASGAQAIGADGEPALKQMAPMLRRHAARLGRMACDVAYRTLGDLREIPIVYSSRYGEVDRSVELLRALAAEGAVSPTSFGLSVHNAITGLFAMARSDTANAIALAAGDDSAETGVIEACNLLADGADRVLLVVADCPVPHVYEAFQDVAPAALAWACLLSKDVGDRFALEWSDAGSADAAGVVEAHARPESGSAAAVRFLISEEAEFSRHSGAKMWRWCRND